MSLELSGMVNESELLINVVINNKPKMLRGLNQKVSSPAQRLNSSLTEMMCYRRKGRNLTRSGIHVERGKPVAFPSGKVSRKTNR